MPLRNLVVIFLSLIISLVCYTTSARNRYANTIAEAIEVVENRALIKLDRRDLFKSAMNGMLIDLDPNSSFVSDDDYLALDEDIKQEFAGVGLRVQISKQTGMLTIIRPVVNTPAQRAGLLSGDVILEIDGKSTEGVGNDQAISMIRGPKGEAVELLIQRGEAAPFAVSIVRDTIPVPSVYGDTRNADGSWNFFLQSNPRIGYIRLEKFGERSTSEMQAALSQISGKVDSLILDLRSNYGGVMEAAIEISDMFLPGDKIIVSTKDREDRILDRQFSTRAKQLDHSIPMVVMINRRSASASEIVAACLQDHKRALIVGEQSYGKGTVQHLIPIEQGRSFIKLTVASYWRPSNRNIDRTVFQPEQEDQYGVIPDEGYACDLTEEQVNELEISRLIRDLGPDYSPVSSDEIKVGEWETIDKALQQAINYLKSVMKKKAAA